MSPPISVFSWLRSVSAQAGVGRVRYPNAIVDVAGENLDLILKHPN
jgi:hypothetical protein